VLRHAPDLDPERVSERTSANGNFLSISYVLRARSREQIEALVAELKTCDGVLMLL
jgi:putative lipoic acid-binding regulatory protein